MEVFDPLQNLAMSVPVPHIGRALAVSSIGIPMLNMLSWVVQDW
jgi:hypothetical protein